MKQCTDFTSPFKELLEWEAAEIGMRGKATLAVHLRLTDKTHSEAKENAELSNETIVGKIKTCMDKLGCATVFVCSDNQTRKAEIQQMLASQDIHCITYAAVLSPNANVGLHFSSIPAHAHSI